MKGGRSGPSTDYSVAEVRLREHKRESDLTRVFVATPNTEKTTKQNQVALSLKQKEKVCFFSMPRSWHMKD
jgi:hypothetical protein